MKTEYFESAEVSDVGRSRKNNEDSCLRIAERGVYCVADGMGGVAGGDLASETITTSLRKAFGESGAGAEETFSGRVALFRKAADEASQWIKSFADAKVISQMGSTVVALVFDPQNPTRAAGLHAGDSRLYRFRGGELKLLTRDHSAIETLAAKLGCDPASLPAKYQNELVRAVGLKDSVELEQTRVDVVSGDIFLLCSDGLTRMVPDDAIAKILARSAREPIGAVAQALIAQANEAGGKDNVTVVLVKVGDISAFPAVVEPEEEEEAKTVIAPALAEAEEASRGRAEPVSVPDTADEGVTPPTQDAPRQTANPVRRKESRRTIVWAVVIVASLAAAFWGQSLFSRRSAQSASDSFSGTPNLIEDANPNAVGELQELAALKLAREAMAKNDYLQAASHAVEVLKFRPTNAEAQIIKQNAEKQSALLAEHERRYRAVVTQAAEALRNGKYADALARSQETLALKPTDTTANQIADQARIQLALADALGLARDAMSKSNYAGAITNAVKALGIESRHAEAGEIKQRAEAQLALLADAKRQYDAAIENAEAATKRGDFAEGLRSAKEAMSVRPGDADARQWEQRAQEGLDLGAAQKAFDECDYAGVLALCRAHPSAASFMQLAESSRAEQSALALSQERFGKGEYGFIGEVEGKSWAGKKQFKELAAKGRSEKTLLDELRGWQKQGSWSAVTNGLQALPAATANKPPFRDVAQWAAANDAINKLDGELKLYRVWLGAEKPEDNVIDPATRHAAQKLSAAAETGALLPAVKGLRQRYENLSALTSQRNEQIAGLEKAIALWSERNTPAPAIGEGRRTAEELDAQFETLLVWFNIKTPKDPYIRTAKARNERRLEGEIGAQRDELLKSVSALEQDYRKGGGLNDRERGKYLAELKKTIMHHE